MRLDELLSEIPANTSPLKSGDREINAICSDSRKVGRGDVYVALKGARFNGNDYIKDAVRRGAIAVVTEENVGEGNGAVDMIRVTDARDVLYRIVEKFYGHPSREVKTVGITGTNGKTTVAYLIESILKSDQKRCGVIGTVNYRIGDQVVEAAQTTPDYVENQKFLAGLARDQVPYCVMEVSSHALTQDRVRGIDFCAGVFTNVTSDHLDYHKTRDEYFSSKARLFTVLDDQAAAIINTDDLYGRQLLAMTNAKITSYGLNSKADLSAHDIVSGIAGSRFTLHHGKKRLSVKTQLIGRFNVYNILAAAGFALSQGIEPARIADGVAQLRNVPGRLQRIDFGQNYSIFIDYAHTEDALSNVLQALRPVCEARIILVFGCGGDRDMTKRKHMGRVADELADYSIVTSDNPRSEDPHAIIDQITEGFLNDQYCVEPDRKEAIRKALVLARAGDVVLLAGKGHETYQVIGQEKIDFNEREIVRECLR